MGAGLIELGMLAVASGTLSVAITNSHITRSLRLHYLDAPYMLGELINCSFCMGFWISLVLSIINYGHLDVLAWLTAWGFGALFSGVLLKLYLFRESENEDLRDTIREMSDVIKELTGEER